VSSTHGPSVWTGRALQVENDDLEKVGLALLYPSIDGALELLAINIVPHLFVVYRRCLLPPTTRQLARLLAYPIPQNRFGSTVQWSCARIWH
jgi:hypothetical protein